jgi:hypothetical protein
MRILGRLAPNRQTGQRKTPLDTRQLLTFWQVPQLDSLQNPLLDCPSFRHVSFIRVDRRSFTISSTATSEGASAPPVHRVCAVKLCESRTLRPQFQPS